MKKKKIAKPDEFYSRGRLSVARFGNDVVMRSEIDDDQFRQLQERLLERLPDVETEINELIKSVVAIVAANRPDEILKRAWWNQAMRAFDYEAEADLTTGDGVAFRLIDYIQCVIASIPPSENVKDEFSDEDWAELESLVEKLFGKVNFEYATCLTAKRKNENPDFDLVTEEFRYRAQFYWNNVRGKRYQFHQLQALRDILRDQNALIEKVYGVGADHLIAELGKIWHNLTFGIEDVRDEMLSFREKTLTRMDALSECKQAKVDSAENFMAEALEDKTLAAEGRAAMGRLFGLDLFDVGKITDLPNSFLNDFSWAPGEERKFFADGINKGWPERVWPTFMRPFIKIEGRHLCFDIHSLFDNFYRQMERRAFAASKEIKQEWISIRKGTTESLPAKYLTRLLPGAHDYGEVFYQTRTGKQCELNWCETDRLIQFDDTLFVIEVKAGAFTWTSPATDFDAYIASINNLVTAPSKQGDRFIDYIESADEVSIYDQYHNEVGRLRKNEFKRIIKLAVTLDPFTELAAQVQHLRKIGIELGDRPLWSVSIDDLRAFSDVFGNAIEFIHFVEKRIEAIGSERLQLDDELDHLGLYIEHNNYAMRAQEMNIGENGALKFVGYRSKIDKYFSARLANETVPNPLTQSMPPRLREIVEFLSTSNEAGRTTLACRLLDIAGDWRETTFGAIDEELRRIESGSPPRPHSSFGDVRLTVHPWRLSSTPLQAAAALEHAKAQIILHDEPDRLLLKPIYSEADKLIALKWVILHRADIPESEVPKLKEIAEQLRSRRIEKVRQNRKIGRNERCPCGSGKKYKKCCLRMDLPVSRATRFSYGLGKP